MNIFYVHRNSIIAAQSLGDKHVIKMILESAQLLSTAHRVLDGIKYTTMGKKRKVKRYTILDARENTLYEATHINHPSAVWVRESQGHYHWLYGHFIGLLDEYSFRYNKTHKCTRLISDLVSFPNNMINSHFVDPPCAMPEEYIVPDDAIASYRNYYNGAKKHLHSWKNRKPPDWIIQNV